MAKKIDTEDTEVKSVDEQIEESLKKIEEIKNIDKPKDNPMEKVLIEIPITSELDEDWVCIINGHSYQVQRGEKVLVPRCVKEVYDNQQRQVRESFRRSQALQKAAANKEKQLAFN